jgi:hypothetical protein
MPFIEAPSNFYVGRRYDPEAREVTDDVVYYDSRDLTTHAVVVGMTGSGKTGLCLSLLEEAALDNIPAVIIDPKGDITNLLLVFPDLQPQEFAPWINVDDARRAGMEVGEFAADTAHRWREGLASWGIVPDRLRWMKMASQYSIYTPGSDSGLPVSILASLRAPREGWAGNEEALREKISGLVTALLALVGRNAQPVQDIEHILLSNIFEYAWQRGIDLSIEDIIQQVQRPPFAKLGVMNVDDMVSEKARGKLAMELNNIVAAPSFQSWMNGDPLDFQSLLYQRNGRPRISIFYTAHLNEAERLFITTLLLENALSWMRQQSGTTSLRALLYIDEMFGYFPPYPRNPPTKDPILRLLKQARAFGLGLILATQNPGDLDYKGLTNAGTWFIGRLQAENDKKKVMSGLEAMASMENNLDLKAVDRLISDIQPRVFLMHNVHDTAGPVLVHTRWAMSYLRGPLTRQQVAALMAAQRAALTGTWGTPAPATAAFAPQPAQAAAGFAGAGFAAAHAAYAPSGPPTLPGLPASLPGVARSGGSMPGGVAANSSFYAAQIAAQGAAAAMPPMPGAPAFTEQATAPYVPGTFDSRMAGTVGDAPMQRTTTTANGLPLPPGYVATQPAVSSTMPQFFAPASMTAQQAVGLWQQRTGFTATQLAGTIMAYRPLLLAQATVRFQDKRTQLYTARAYAYQIPELDRAGLVHWEEHVAQAIDPRRLSGEALEQAIFGELSPGLADAKRIAALRREFTDMLYSTATLKIPYNPTLNIYGSPDGDFSQFQAQAQQVAREKRDAEIDALTKKYEGLLDKLEGKQQRTAREIENERQELSKLKREELFTTGEAIFGLLKGQTSFTLSRMSRAQVYKERSQSQLDMKSFDLKQAEEDMRKLQASFEEETRAVNDKWARAAADVQDYTITAFKKDISIDVFGIGWMPYWYAVINGQPVLVAAFQ